MANSLLDFVVSLVRDPDAAARYAADPIQSIADAHLTDVTSSDVNNLIPMVSDSMSMTHPGGASAVGGIADLGNVWASGAATAAFDAFAPHPAQVATADQHGSATGVIDQSLAAALGGGTDASTDPHPLGTELHDPSALFTEPELPDAVGDDAGLGVDDPASWDHSVVDPHVDTHTVEADHHDFNIFG